MHHHHHHRWFLCFAYLSALLGFVGAGSLAVPAEKSVRSVPGELLRRELQLLSQNNTTSSSGGTAILPVVLSEDKQCVQTSFWVIASELSRFSTGRTTLLRTLATSPFASHSIRDPRIFFLSLMAAKRTLVNAFHVIRSLPTTLLHSSRSMTTRPNSASALRTRQVVLSASPCDICQTESFS
jgi:hypothetical protein